MEDYLIPIFALVIYFNAYKIPLMLFDEQYWIFPWNHGQMSGSHGLWLAPHAIWAMIHLGLIMIIGFRKSTIVKYSHYIFCGWVVVNLWHFGELPWYYAIFANGIPLSLMIYGFERSRWVYLTGFLSAPGLEVGLYYYAFPPDVCMIALGVLSVLVITLRRLGY